jgi:hypothetical protein
MGVVACSLFPEIESLALQHGRPVPGKWGGWEGILFSMYHPSAGLKPGGTGYMIAMMQDMEDLRKLLLTLDRGEFSWPEDPYPEPDYQFIRTEDDLTAYLLPLIWKQKTELWTADGGERRYVIGEDTESLPSAIGKLGGGPPFCLTFSHTPGTGRLIYIKDTHLIDSYRRMLHEILPLQLFHNYLHDSDVFDLLSLPTEPFLDTMVRAYNLCLGGGGDEEDEGGSRAGRGSLSLKVLAYRHCNMRMTSFKDTVWPHSIPHMLDWLRQGQAAFALGDSEPVCTCGHKQSHHEARGKTGRHTGPCSCGKCQKWVKVKAVKHESDKTLNLLHRKLGTIINNLVTGKVDSKGTPVDPWKRFKEWEDYDQNSLVELLGPPPLPSIAHVPEAELLHYAVRDADADLRLYLHMRDLKPWIFYT